MPCMSLIEAALEITRSPVAHNTKVGTEIFASAAVSSTDRSAAIRRRMTAASTPAMARSDLRGALGGDADPPLKGARSQRGKDFKGKRAASPRGHARCG